MYASQKRSREKHRVQNEDEEECTYAEKGADQERIINLFSEQLNSEKEVVKQRRNHEKEAEEEKIKTKIEVEEEK